MAEAISSIEDPAAKTAAAIDVFGKSGAEAINMLDNFGPAVENARKFQSAFGIAVSDLDAQKIEAANDAMARLGMATEGLGNAFAVNLAPYILATTTSLTDWIAALIGAQSALDELLGSSARAAAILGPEVAAALLESRGLVKENVTPKHPAASATLRTVPAVRVAR